MSESAFSVKIEIPVAWGDMDAFNHVNNTMFFRYFESARIHYFAAIGMDKYMSDEGVGPILAFTDCRFIQPVTFPDQLTSKVKVEKMGNTSFTMKHQIESDIKGVVAEGSSVVVMVNYGKGEKVTVPPELRRRIEEVEGLTQD